jgi:hypothetical protein
MNHAPGTKICNVLINGSNVAAYGITDSDPAFNFLFSGENFGIPIDQANLGAGYGYSVDYQSVWIAMGQYVSPANIALFRNPSTGLPMDLGTDGSGPTGTAPTYYFQGNAAAFVTNKGLGPTITLTGTPTDVS